MQIGATLPQVGAEASPAGIARAARHAEELGYDSLWVTERLLYPVVPRSRYPGTPDGALPAVCKRVFTPLETLTFAAACARRIALGTSILNMPLHNPVMLARQLATLDVLSGGRLQVGLGQAWSVDELEAGGATPSQRAARADEFIAVLKAIWTTEPAEFAGRYYTLPKSHLQPKPVQRPHPPIYLGGSAPGVLARIARLADGWIPSGVPLARLRPLLDQIGALARASDREPGALECVLLGFTVILPESPGDGRPDFVGTLDEIRGDVAMARDLGVSRLLFVVGYAPGQLTPDDYCRTLEALRTTV